MVRNLWDNPTWTFNNASTTNPGILEDASYATTQVVPSTSNQGCVSWGAVIVSTTVKNPDNDGNLYSWKTDPRGPGYCDAAFNNGVCSGPGDPAWIDLPGATTGQQDVFLQYDYMCSQVTGPDSCDISTGKDSLSAAGAASGGNTTYTGTFSPPIPAHTVVGIAGFTKSANNGQFTVVSCTGTQLVVNNATGVAETNPGIATYAIPGDVNYSFDPRLATDPADGLTAVDKVLNSYVDTTHHSKVVLHAIPGNAISESHTYDAKGKIVPATCTDTDVDPTTGAINCPFPNEPGTVGFREGLAYIKNQTIEPRHGTAWLRSHLGSKPMRCRLQAREKGQLSLCIVLPWSRPAELVFVGWIASQRQAVRHDCDTHNEVASWHLPDPRGSKRGHCDRQLVQIRPSYRRIRYQQPQLERHLLRSVEPGAHSEHHSQSA